MAMRAYVGPIWRLGASAVALAACVRSPGDSNADVANFAATPGLVCEDPGKGTTRWIGVDHNDWATLAGEYHFEVVAIGGAPPGRLGVGRLTLWVNDSLHQRYSVWHEMQPEGPFFFPFYGAVDSTFIWPTWVNTPVSPTSQDPDWPGVQFGKVGERLSFVVGNPRNPRVEISHAGVSFDVTAVDSLGMRGQWESGDIMYPNATGEDWGAPAGYFCAWKRSPPGDP